MTVRSRPLRATVAAFALTVSPFVWSVAVAADGEAGSKDEPSETDYTEFVEVDVANVPASNTVSKRMAVDADRTPVHVAQVGRRLLTEQDADVLGDSLRNVAGVHTVPFNGTFDYFTVRGFDSLSSAVILTDGAPEPQSSFHRDYNIEGVEVLKGPGGFLFGANPLAGAVNVVRKQPLPTDFTDVRVQGGSWGEATGEVDWNAAGDTGDLAFRVNGLWAEGDGWRDRTDFEQSGVNPALSWSPRPGTRIHVNAEFASLENGPDAGIPLVAGAVPDVARTTSYQSPFDRSEQDVSRFQVDVEHDVDDHLTLRNKTYYRRLEWRSTGTIFGGDAFFAPEPTVARLLLDLDDDQRFFGNRFEAVFDVGGAVRHQVLVGVELARREDRYTLLGGLLPDIAVLDPVETATDLPFLLPFDAFDPATPGAGDNAADIVAPYVVDQIRFGERFEILLGVRHDSIRFEDDLTGTRRTDSDVSPMAGVLFRATSSTTLFANAGSSFAPAGPRVPGSPDPEETDQIEIGVRQDLPGDRGRLTAAAYRLDRANIAILDDNGFSQQQGDQRSTGVEVEMGVRVAPRTHLVLAYAWNDAELTRFTELELVGFDPVTFQPIYDVADRSGNTPPFAPEHLASAWLRHAFRSGPWVAAGVRHVSEQTIAPNNAFEIGAYTLVDAAAGWNLGDWTVQVNLNNVLDEDYETRGFGTSSVTPGTPFQVTAGVGYRF